MSNAATSPRRGGWALTGPAVSHAGGQPEFVHQGERRWGVIGLPHGHALSEFAGSARGACAAAPPPAAPQVTMRRARSHAADTRLTGSGSTSSLVPQTVVIVPLRALARRFIKMRWLLRSSVTGRPPPSEPWPAAVVNVEQGHHEGHQPHPVGEHLHGVRPRHPAHLVKGPGPIHIGDGVDSELRVRRREVDTRSVVKEPHVIAPSRRTSMRWGWIVGVSIVVADKAKPDADITGPLSPPR